LFRALSGSVHDRDLFRFSEVFAKVTTPNPLVLVRQIEQLFSLTQPKARFSHVVRNTLYESFKLSATAPLLRAIGALCAGTHAGHRLRCVITYNFDGILEDYLHSLPITVPFESVFRSDQPYGSKLPIFHVHGFVPSNSEANHSDLVFTEGTYHRQYEHFYTWSNIIQLQHFSQDTCLFLGLSLTDPNIRRLLDIATRFRPRGQQPHYLIKRAPRQAAIMEALSSVRDGLTSDPDRHAYIQQIMADEATIEHIRDLQMVLDEKDAASLGLNILWTDEFGDMPHLLKLLLP
jgi:hypothetical protein